MPKISDKSSYPQDASIDGTEYVIGTNELSVTNTYTIDSIKDYTNTSLLGSAIVSKIDGELGQTGWKIADLSLSEVDQTISVGVNRIVDAIGSGSFQVKADGNLAFMVGASNGGILLADIIGEINTGGVSFPNSVLFSTIDTGAVAASTKPNLIYRDTATDDLMYSNGTTWFNITNQSGTSRHLIEDETVVLTARPSLNFTGTGVTATDNVGDNATDIAITDNSLSEVSQTIGDTVTRLVNTINTGSINFQQNGTTILKVGDNNDQAIKVLSMETLSGSTIGLVSPIKYVITDVTITAASPFDGSVVEHSVDGELYFSNGTVWSQLTNQGGSTSQLSDLSDVNTSTPTNRFILIADGTDFESRALIEADISDLQSYALDTIVLKKDTINSISSLTNITASNGVGIIMNPSLDTLTIKGGDTGDTSNVSISLEANKIDIAGLSEADIDSSSITSIITKGWAETNFRTAIKITYDNTTSGLTAVEVQAAIDEVDVKAFTNTSLIGDNAGEITTNSTDIATINAFLAVVPTSTINFQQKTTPYTLISSDAKDDVIIQLDYNGEDLTIPSGVFNEGEVVKIVYENVSAGDANIIEGSGVSLVGFTDGVTLNTYPSGVTLVRTSAVTSPEEWEILDYFGTITDFVCSFPSTEQHNVQNAASVPTCKELNTTTGWTDNGSPITSETGGAQDGTYFLQTVAFSGSANRAEYTFSITSGDTFTITLDAQQTVGTQGALTSWANLTGGPSSVSLTGSWVTYVYNVTASTTGTATIRIYSALSGGAASDTVQWDKFSIIKTN